MTDANYMAVTDEVWEANRWFISTAWSKPIASPQFSDFTEKIGYKDFPKSPEAPEGWKWASEWVVDKSQSFGPVDEDGWAYGTSFESLQECIETNSTSSESAGMKALVRRRKWVRTRVCYCKKIFDQLTAKIETLNATRASIEKSMRQQQKNLTRVKKFELARVKAYETSFTEFVEDLDVVGKIMRDYMIKLAKMKTFLQERSVIEKEYGQRLKQLSLKWIHAGAPTAAGSAGPRASSVDRTTSTTRSSFGSVSSENNNELSRESMDIARMDAEVETSRTGFFYLINSSSLEVGDNLEGFADLVSDSLCRDVDDLLFEVSRITTDYLNEAPRLRARLLAKEEQVVRTIRVLHSDVDCFLAKSSNHIVSIMNEIMALQSTGKSLAGSSSTSEKKIVPFDCAGYSDIFLCFQKYLKAVQGVSEHLDDVDKFCETKFPIAQTCCKKVGVLLQSIAKIFANEQMRVWAGANELATHLKVIKRGSTVVVDEEQIMVENTLSEKYEDSFQTGGDGGVVEGGEDGVVDDEECRPLYDKTLTLPECVGIAKHGMIRYCETTEALLETAATTGVVLTNGPGVTFSDLYAILFVDGMLHLYKNTPVSHNIAAKKAYAEISSESIAERTSSITSESSVKLISESWADWIGETPARSLCLANSSGPVSLVPAPGTNDGDEKLQYVPQFSSSCEVSMLLSSDAEQEVFRVKCYTTTKAASISVASANALTRSAAELGGIYASSVSVFTSCEGAAAGDAKEWMQAIVQPYNRNHINNSEEEVHL